MVKKIITVLSAALLIITMGAVIASAEESEGPEANRDVYDSYAVKGGTVTNVDELLAAFTDAREGYTDCYAEKVVGKENTIQLNYNVIIKAPIYITSGSYTIVGADRTVYRGGDTDLLFHVTSETVGVQPSLTLEGEMTIDGMSDKYRADSGLIMLYGNARFTAKDVNFVYSDANGSIGGAIFSQSIETSEDFHTGIGPDVTLESCEFKSCRSQGGGAIAATSSGTMFDGEFNINNCIFENNSTFESDGSYCDGGAIYVTACYFQISDCTFTGCVGDNGGVIYTNKSIKLIDNIFENNKSRYDGGVIYSEGDITVDGGRMMNNLAENNGGAIAGRGKLTTNTVYISENEAKNNGGSVCFDGTYNFNNGNITLGKAGNIGGGIYLKGSMSVLNMTDGEIVSCKAKYAASVYCKGAFNFSGGAIGKGESDFPQIFVEGSAQLGSKSFVEGDVFAIAVKKVDGKRVYPTIKLTDTPAITTEFTVAYAEEKLDDKENTTGFSNATRSGKVIFSGSAEAIKKASEVFSVKSRGLLSYVISDEGELSVRFIYLPIWSWILIAVAVLGALGFIFRKKLVALVSKIAKKDKKNKKKNKKDKDKG